MDERFLNGTLFTNTHHSLCDVVKALEDLETDHEGRMNEQELDAFLQNNISPKERNDLHTFLLESRTKVREEACRRVYEALDVEGDGSGNIGNFRTFKLQLQEQFFPE